MGICSRTTDFLTRGRRYSERVCTLGKLGMGTAYSSMRPNLLRSYDTDWCTGGIGGGASGLLASLLLAVSGLRPSQFRGSRSGRLYSYFEVATPRSADYVVDGSVLYPLSQFRSSRPELLRQPWRPARRLVPRSMPSGWPYESLVAVLRVSIS